MFFTVVMCIFGILLHASCATAVLLLMTSIMSLDKKQTYHGACCGKWSPTTTQTTDLVVVNFVLDRQSTLSDYAPVFFLARRSSPGIYDHKNINRSATNPKW